MVKEGVRKLNIFLAPPGPHYIPLLFLMPFKKTWHFLGLFFNTHTLLHVLFGFGDTLVTPLPLVLFGDPKNVTSHLNGSL